MKLRSKIHQLHGRILYTLLYPVFAVYRSTRTRGLILDQDNNILLVKNWISNDSWDLPGGGLHSTESLSVGLSREVREETGIEINHNAWKFLAEHHVNATKFMYFAAVTSTKKPNRQKLELTGAEWFSQDALPSKRNPMIDQLLSIE